MKGTDFLRDFLKSVKVVPISEMYEEEADIVNNLIPVWIDRMTDEEIITLFKEREVQEQADSWPPIDGLGSGNILKEAILGDNKNQEDIK